MKVIVTVKPGSKKGPLVQPGTDGELLVHVREPAHDGKANAAIIELLAKHYGVAKSNLEIARGHTSKRKVVKINE